MTLDDPWFLSEFRFPSISLEWIDGIWTNFGYALILTRSRLGLLHINFSQIYNRVIALDIRICFRSITWEWIDGIWPNSAYALILTRSTRLGILRVNFHQIVTEFAYAKFDQLILKLLSGNKILTSIKGNNSVINCENWHVIIPI